MSKIIDPFVNISALKADEIKNNPEMQDARVMNIGFGSKVFRADKQGIWLGAKKFGDGVFSVDMDGNVIATSIVAGAYTQIFVQPSIPTSLHINDLWVDSDDDNKPYRAAKVGATTIAAGEWEGVDNPTEWADVLNGASNKPANNADVTGDNNKWSEVNDDDGHKPVNDATKNTGALADLDDVASAQIQANVEIKNSMCEIQKFEAGEDIAQGKALIVGDGLDSKVLTIDSAGSTGTNAQIECDHWEGQGFITPSLIYKIKSVTLYLGKSGTSVDGDIVVAIRTNTNGTYGSTNLVSKAIASNSIPTGPGNVTFTFTTPLVLAADTLYAIIVYHTGTDLSDSITWYTNTANPYNHNYCYRIRSDNGGSSFYNVTAEDKRCYITYQQSHAGKIYLASAEADNCFVNNFVGFANQAANKNADVEICMGRLYRRAYVGVNEGGAYHLRDTPRGDISTTPGTITKQVAIGMKDSYLFQLFDS